MSDKSDETACIRYDQGLKLSVLISVDSCTDVCACAMCMLGVGNR